MKKIIMALVATAVITAFGAGNARAQQSAIEAATQQPNDTGAMPGSEVSANSSAPAVSLKALKDFGRSYKSIAKPRWSISLQGGFTASFKEAGISHNVYYNHRGSWLFAIKRYDESKLDKAVQYDVMTGYRGYTINGVAEIEMPGKTVYLFFIQNATDFKTLRYMDNDVEEIEWIHNSRIMQQ